MPRPAGRWVSSIRSKLEPLPSMNAGVQSVGPVPRVGRSWVGELGGTFVQRGFRNLPVPIEFDF